MGMPPVIIVGMHRSGTTMLSKILEELGVFMGWRKDENNEALFFLRFNEWVLKQANATWDNPYNYTLADEDFKNLMTNLAERYIRSIRRIEYLGLIKGLKYRSLKELDFPWGWKDPRNTFTLDIWLKVFPDAKIIHIYRNPIDVAESLRKRTKKLKRGFEWTWKKEIKFLLMKGYIWFGDSQRVENIYEGIKLWEDYVNRVFVLEKESNLKVLHIKYENFLENPMITLEQILEFIGIDIEKTRILSVTNYINKSKRYVFLENPELREIFKEIQQKELLQKLGYNIAV